MEADFPDPPHLPSAFSGTPRLAKAGLVLVEPEAPVLKRVIVLQYNPETLSRTLAPQGSGGEGERSSPFRIKAPPVETIKLEALIDATDALEFPGKNARERDFGLHPALAALETLLFPPSARLISNNALAQLGTLEITPVEAPLLLFVWSRHRVVPVRITEFSVAEEAFDAVLNPIRAKLSLGLRVLTTQDFGFEHRGGRFFLAYLQAKEQLAKAARSGALGELGLARLP